MQSSPQDCVADAVARIFGYGDPAVINARLGETYPKYKLQTHARSRIYIAQIERGDFATCSLSSFVVAWWEIFDDAINRIYSPKIDWHDPDGMFVTPVLKFYLLGNSIIVGESFGPEFMCRKIGVIVNDGNAIRVADLKVAWHPDYVTCSG